jgi:hypothetical protein
MLLTTIQLGAAPQQHCYVAGHESSAQGMCMGTRTLQTQHAVELLGLPMDKVKSVLLDTAQCYPQTANVTFSIWPHRYRKHYSVSSREVTRRWVTGKNSERAECDNCSAFRRYHISNRRKRFRLRPATPRSIPAGCRAPSWQSACGASQRQLI